MENNQTQTQPQMTTKLGNNVPEYIKKRLATVEAQKTKEPNSQPSNDEVKDANPKEDQVPEPTAPTELLTNKTEEAEEIADKDSDNNEVKAWKGRIAKEQNDHKETKNKLLAEVEARQKAEQETAELKARLDALEKAKTADQEQTKSQAQQNPNHEVENFTAEEIDSMRLAMGDEAVNKLLKNLSNRPNVEVPDVGKMVEERFSKMQAEQSEQARHQQFIKEINEKVPRLQALIIDPEFISFAETKEIDYLGNKASALLNYTGQNKDISLIPMIAKLVDEFEQTNQPPAEKVTAPPSNKGGATKHQTPKAKKEMTSQDKSHAHRLAIRGKKKELKEFLAQFS